MGVLKRPLGDNVVHLCLDMQRLFSADGPWPAPWVLRVLPVVVRLVEHEPRRCVFTRFIPPESPASAGGMWRAFYNKWPHVTRERLKPAMLDLLSPLQRFVPPATVVDKPGYSAFFATGLKDWLSVRSVDTLIVTGSETDVCVLSTVLAAIDFGYRVILVEDAVCSSSDRTHDALMTLYNSRFDLQIEVASADEVLAFWRT